MLLNFGSLLQLLQLYSYGCSCCSCYYYHYDYHYVEKAKWPWQAVREGHGRVMSLSSLHVSTNKQYSAVHLYTPGSIYSSHHNRAIYQSIYSNYSPFIGTTTVSETLRNEQGDCTQWLQHDYSILNVIVISILAVGWEICKL